MRVFSECAVLMYKLTNISPEKHQRLGSKGSKRCITIDP